MSGDFESWADEALPPDKRRYPPEVGGRMKFIAERPYSGPEAQPVSWSRSRIQLKRCRTAGSSLNSSTVRFCSN